MEEPRPTLLGKLVSILLVLGLVGTGLYLARDQLPAGLRGLLGGSEKAPADQPANDETAGEGGEAAEATPALREVPRLDPPGPYQPQNGVVEIEISEYAGYAGLVAANGGLEPNDASLFTRYGGFKVRLSVSEEESWSKLNRGGIGASTTTVDVLAVYGRQFGVTVPAQIGFSRGADGLVVRTGVTRINDLRGKVVATAQFTEVDFLIRYLAQEAGIPLRVLDAVDAPPSAEAINLVFTDDGFAAGDLFLADLRSGSGKLAGCVTWEPKVSEVVNGSGGKARVLTTNRNLLIIADILVVNRGFAEQHPEMVAALVRGLLEGNRLVREQTESQLDVVAKAFGWTREQARSELAKVHLSNLPENLAFFSGAIDAAGSYGGIYQSAVLAYGDVVRDPVDGDRFLALQALQALEGQGVFKDQKIGIAPVRTRGPGSIERDPLLSKDIRFFFEPNSTVLDVKNEQNLRDLEGIKKLLQVSPGSTILLRGHVDNSLVEEFRRQGGDQFVRQMALKAMELSKNRANEIRRILVERYGVTDARLEVVGRGWEEPAGPDPDKNRRVEVQWFTVE